MPQEKPIGCARPTGGVVGGKAPAKQETPAGAFAAQGARTMITVGRKAPDFTAPAYDQGKFVSVGLSEYLGKWVALCFYPGDFTFV